MSANTAYGIYTLTNTTAMVRGSGDHMSMEKMLDRAATMIGSYGLTGTHPDQLEAETVATARCKLIAQSMELFIRFCYVRDAQGRFCHLAGNTIIPHGVFVPWGSAGKPRDKEVKARPELTRIERDIVRMYLAFLKRKRLFPLFVYLSGERRWMVDTVRYETEQAALAWLESQKLDARNFISIRCTLTQKKVG